ncbi:MAG: SDR family oxidoreductase [Anaerolineaceae bacterium]|nr:SDR family oxidoreductase [Anaerolineaceae bacterium]
MLDREAFAGKGVLVTGASRGIGRATALAFAQHGATVVVNYRADEAGARDTLAVLQQTGGTGYIIQADVADPDSVQRMVSEIEELVPTVDVLVNNAAAFNRSAFLDVGLEDFDASFNTNVRGVYYLSQLVARGMVKRGQGSIIHISSILAKLSVPNRSVYCATKGAIESLTKAMALDLVDFGVRVNAIAPGLISTEAMTVGFGSDTLLAEMESHIPGGKFGMPEDIASTVMFLASDLARYITGVVLPVDMGLSAREAGPV